MKLHDKAGDELVRDLTNNGRLIEAGWVELHQYAITKNAPAAWVRELRMVYFAGAHFLFSHILRTMGSDQSDESAGQDLARLNLISAELDAFAREVEQRVERNAKNAEREVQ